MLTVHGRATSSNVQKVMWTIAELGLPHRRLDVGGHFGGTDTPAYRALNPHGLVPAVEFPDGLVMWESNAIVRHLARTDPERRLWPEGRAEPLTDMWAEWAHNHVARPVTALFWALVRTRPADREPALVERHRREAAAGMAMADEVLRASPFLAGEHLSIADIVFGHTLYRWNTMEIGRPDLPALCAYYARLTEHPAYATHVMVDYATLRAR